MKNGSTPVKQMSRQQYIFYCINFKLLKNKNGKVFAFILKLFEKHVLEVLWCNGYHFGL